ncbi:MAG TPA: alkaline phosphatase D family protein [Flavitalea sp.]|nr:alkaline phosphatase D family protein [Flavitalea sp.]
MRAYFTLLFFLSITATFAQLVSGPMLGQIELRTAKIWVEVKPGTTVHCRYWKKGNTSSAQNVYQSTNKETWYAPVTFDLVGLDINTTYEYQIQTGTAQKVVKATGEFTTKDLWQYRKPVPDFTFLTGSCAYFNEPVYDRPGAPYGKDSSIFEAMAKEQAAFMIWLGDNWYLREVDFSSEWGIWYRAHRDRSHPILQGFLKSMPQIAIWDDHDFGPNDSDKSFHLKEISRKVFLQYWANASAGEGGEGIYTKFSYGDVDFFLMDDRYFRSPDDMQTLIDGNPNPMKRMWGPKQMEWLKSALRFSRAPFKIIVTGSQTLNVVSPFNCLQAYPIEFEEFMAFINLEKIGGIVFLTGDRHHSEVVKYDRTNNYTLYDITSSPLTSAVGRVGGKEKDNPSRIAGTLVEDQNYSRITVSGKPNERTLTVEFMGAKGGKLATWSVRETDLRSK